MNDRHLFCPDAAQLLAEDVLTLRQACRTAFFRRPDGRPSSVNPVYRAVFRGLRGYQLEAVQTSAGIRTSSEAIARLAQRLSDPSAPATKPRGRQRQMRIAAAESELAAQGL